MPRRTLEERLEELSALREGGEEERGERLARLTEALADRHHQIVARAARLAAELSHDELVPELVAAFERLLPLGVKGDKTCTAKVAIAKALLDLEAYEPELFERGARLRQLEPSFGPPVDTAAELRAVCALGLVQSGHGRAALLLAELLADPEPVTRRGALQALAAWRLGEAAPLLRLKALVGDPEVDVLSTCLESLLELEREDGVDFVARFLDGDDPALAEAAAYALGGSRLEGAFQALSGPLAEGSPSSFDPERRRPLFMAISMLRRDDALDYLLEEIRDAPLDRAGEALSALSLHRGDERLVERLRTAVAERDDEALRRELHRIL